MKLVAAIALILALAVGACTLLADDPPDTSCKADSDCFTNVEQCNLDAGVCEAKPDAP